LSFIFFFVSIYSHVIKCQYYVILYEIFLMKYEFLGLYDEDLDLFMIFFGFFYGFLLVLKFFLIKKDNYVDIL